MAVKWNKDADAAEVSSFINENFVPLEVHIKEHPKYFHRFDAVWTPTVLILDSNGVERQRNLRQLKVS